MNLFRHGEEPEVERLKRDVEKRLEKVCASWPAADREALVLKIVQNELMFPSGRLMADIILEDDIARAGIRKTAKR